MSDQPILRTSPPGSRKNSWRWPASGSSTSWKRPGCSGWRSSAPATCRSFSPSPSTWSARSTPSQAALLLWSLVAAVAEKGDLREALHVAAPRGGDRAGGRGAPRGVDLALQAVRARRAGTRRDHRGLGPADRERRRGGPLHRGMPEAPAGDVRDPRPVPAHRPRGRRFRRAGSPSNRRRPSRSCRRRRCCRSGSRWTRRISA